MTSKQKEVKSLALKKNLGTRSTLFTVRTLKSEQFISNSKALQSETRRSATILDLELNLEEILNRCQALGTSSKSFCTEFDVFESHREDAARALCVWLK